MLIDLGIDAWITIVTLVAVMAALLFTRLRSDVVFLGAIGILFVTGVLDTTEAFSGLVSSTVIIVGVMFVVVTGLSFTGVLQWISKHVLGQPKGEVHALLRLMVPVALLSSFVNNTSVRQGNTVRILVDHIPTAFFSVIGNMTFIKVIEKI